MLTSIVLSPVGDPISGAYSSTSNQASVSASSSDAAELIPSEAERPCQKVGAVGVSWTSEEDAVIRVGFEAGKSWK